MKLSINRPTPSNRAFTLIELLVVVAIIALMLVMAAPTMTSAFKGSKLNQGAEALRNFLASAHLTAIKRNLPVEVRFYKYDDPETPESTVHCLAYQMYVVELSNDSDDSDVSRSKVVYTKVGDLKQLPAGVVISIDPTQSTLLGTEMRTGKESIKGVDPKTTETEVDFYAFQFRPDGSMNLSTTKKWFLTVMGRDEYIRNKEKTPSNYVCLKLNAFNGDIRWLQPN